MMNLAEQYVSELCENSFLPLWTYPNPQGKNGKELCDLLVVCDPDVIIFSVKEIKFKESGRPIVNFRRWRRKAILNSVEQIFKAERWMSLEGLDQHVTTKSGMAGLALPNKQDRKIHRISIAIGGENKVRLSSKLFDDKGVKKYVHVFDCISFRIIMKELDTITDFVAYLKAKESLEEQGTPKGDEKDMLALYIQHGKKFPDKNQAKVCWEIFSQSPQYQAKKQADEISYEWDRIISIVCQDHIKGVLGGEQDVNSVDQTIRTMARENRFARRVLAKGFKGFLEANKRGETVARSFPGLARYIFLARPVGTNQHERQIYLWNYCLVARWMWPDRPEIICIAKETLKQKPGFSYHLANLLRVKLTQEESAEAERLQKEYGYFRNLRQNRAQEDGYPL